MQNSQRDTLLAVAQAEREAIERKTLAEQAERRLLAELEQDARQAAWQLEQDAKQAEHDRKLEFLREKALQSVSRPVSRPVSPLQNGESVTPVFQPLQPVADTKSDDIDTDLLLQYYSENPKSSLRKAGEKFGVTHTRIKRALEKLESEGRVHVNGKVEVSNA